MGCLALCALIAVTHLMGSGIRARASGFGVKSGSQKVISGSQESSQGVESQVRQSSQLPLISLTNIDSNKKHHVSST